MYDTEKTSRIHKKEICIKCKRHDDGNMANEQFIIDSKVQSLYVKSGIREITGIFPKAQFMRYIPVSNFDLFTLTYADVPTRKSKT